MKSRLILTAFVIICAVLCLCCGSRFMLPDELISSPLLNLRLMRLCAAFITGAALALSGMIFQAVLRNPLADSFTLGLSGGAGVCAALAYLTGLTAVTVYAVPLSAFAGSLLVLGIVLAISKGGARGHESLLLSGVITGTVSSGILMFLLSEAQAEDLAGLTWWMLGDLQTPDPKFLFPLSILTLLCAVFFHLSGHDLDALSFGDDRAFYLGVEPKRFAVCFIVPAALLTAGTVALAGMIGFCGLIIPHIVRLIFGCSHRKNIIPCFLCGGLFLMIADAVSRSVFPEREIPIGVLTAVIGGPVFLWLLNRRSNYGA